MAWFFGDGFDLYAATADMILGHWDSSAVINNFSIAAGRFSGTRGIAYSSGSGAWLIKSSGQNDAVHHINIAYNQQSAITGSTLGFYIQLSDGATNQCCIVFRQDGAILLTSATPAGTVLATYTGAVTAINTWYSFEFEVVINNVTGSFAVRKNGNNVNDFIATNLNTRPGANAYANKVTIGLQNALIMSVDDFLWRSDAASVSWAGDIRCYTRRPVSDAAVQWTPGGAGASQFYNATTAAPGGPPANVIWAMPITANRGAPISALLAYFTAAFTGHINMAIYDNSGAPASGLLSNGSPGTLLGQATPLTNPGSGLQTFTLTTPVPLVAGTQYWVAAFSDTASAQIGGAAAQTSSTFNQSYGSGVFPSSISGSILSSIHNGFFYIGWQYSTTNNYGQVSELQQDAAASYVLSSTVGQSDLYNIDSITSTPTTILGVVTRGLLQKSDAGTRNAAVQLKSGSATVESASAALNTTWGWVERTDLVDPATSAPWTAIGVSSSQIGAVVKA